MHQLPTERVFCRRTSTFEENASLMNVTIKDIAKMANVSYASVSRALNGKEGVSQATKTRILAIAQEMNYQPNEIARGLVKKQTLTLGLIIPDITNPFYPFLARGAEERANQAGYNLFLCNTNYQIENEIKYIQILIEKRVDGLIISPSSSQTERLEEKVRNALPIVYVSNAPQQTQNGFVVSNNTYGGFIATKHLIESGYDPIGFIGGFQGAGMVEDRLQGFRDAHRAYGMEVREDFVYLKDYHQETAYHLIQEMIRSRQIPKAIVAGNDILALGIMEGAKNLGFSIPADLAVVGFDDIPLASMEEIQLTTVKQPQYEMGSMSVDILVRLLENPADLKTKKVILDPQLIVRKTA